MEDGQDDHDNSVFPIDVPPEVQAIGRSRPSPSSSSLREKKEEKVPLNQHGTYKPAVRRTLCSLRHFTVVIAPKTNLIDGWENLTDKKQRMYCAAVLAELHDLNYRDLEEVLDQNKLLALEAGFNPDDTPDHTTLSRHIGQFNEEVIKEIAESATNAALHDIFKGYSAFQSLSPRPSKPLEYYEVDSVNEDREVSMGEKMNQASEVVAEYMQLALPYIGFDRDTSAPNLQYPTESFYRLLAHIAIEDCHLKNGYEIFEWQSDDGVTVPPPDTLRRYVKNIGGVKDIEKQFLKATNALLNRESLGLPDGEIHLAYDITQKPWYGGEHGWTTGSKKKDNTTQFWHYAVLSTVSPGQNYILGAAPIKNRSEVSETLERMLRNVKEHLDFDIGRIYMDRQMYQTDIVKLCRGYGLNWMIQAPMKGEAKRLAKEAEQGEPKPDSDFDGLELNQKVNAFAYPLNENEVGYDDRVNELEQTKITKPGKSKSSKESRPNPDEDDSSLRDFAGEDDDIPEIKEEEDKEEGEQNPHSHTVWITNLDVDNRDLKGLNYQFRNRWKIETAIRQLKHTFQGRCGSSNRIVRAHHIASSTLFFNFWVALNNELPYHLGDPDNLRLTGLELLHAIRDADFEAAKTGSNVII
jgi:hypothetical protein